jgi:hypothetical protein
VSFIDRSIDMSANEVKEKVKAAPTKWDEAITDARRKIKHLESTIDFYRRSKKAGDSWPGPLEESSVTVLQPAKSAHK